MGYGGNHLSNGKYLRTIGYHADKRLLCGKDTAEFKESFFSVVEHAAYPHHASGSPLINARIWFVHRGSYYPQKHGRLPFKNFVRLC